MVDLDKRTITAVAQHPAPPAGYVGKLLSRTRARWRNVMRFPGLA